MKQVFLPKRFEPVPCSLIRLGSKFDGGYLLPPELLANSDGLLSLGANYDISFEKHFYSHRATKVVIVDASVKLRKLLKSSLKSLLLGRWSDSFRYAYATLDQWRFTSKSSLVDFRFDFVGNLEGQVSLSDILSSSFSNDNILISCDIEGHEYRILNELLVLQSRFSGLIIEFHDCDTHLAQIENFISNFDLDICHVHVNNCGPVSKERFPTTLEITFSRYLDRGSKSLIFPNVLDSPCDPYADDYEISFID